MVNEKDINKNTLFYSCKGVYYFDHSSIRFSSSSSEITLPLSAS